MSDVTIDGEELRLPAYEYFILVRKFPDQNWGTFYRIYRYQVQAQSARNRLLKKGASDVRIIRCLLP